MAAVKLGVLGGTFDPVHVGHLVLAEQAREQLALDRVLWVPTGDPWRKSEDDVSAAEHRCAMVRLAVQDNPAFELCTLEVERQGPSYSVDTFVALRDNYSDAQFAFLLGLDSLRDVPNWREPQRLLELTSLAVAPRAGERLAKAELERLLPGLSERVVWVEMPRIDISATELRRRVAEGRSVRYQVPAAVDAYIREHRLYGRA
jgi:nicotinate-nucleotide adenylyltransferase